MLSCERILEWFYQPTKNMRAKSEDKAAHQIHKNYLEQRSNEADWDYLGKLLVGFHFYIIFEWAKT